MTNSCTGGHSSTPVLSPFSQWPNQSSAIWKKSRTASGPKSSSPTWLDEKSVVCDHGPTISRCPLRASSVMPFALMPVKFLIAPICWSYQPVVVSAGTATSRWRSRNPKWSEAWSASQLRQCFPTPDSASSGISASGRRQSHLLLSRSR